MNKKIIVAVVVVILLGVIGFLVKQKQPVTDNQKISDSLVATSTLTQATATSSPVKEVKPVVSLVQPVPYVDQTAKFSLNLPKGWSENDKKISSTTSNTWFAGASSTMVVTRHARTAETEALLTKLGPGGLIDTIVNNIVSGLNQYNLVSTKSMSVNGVPYRQVISTYVGVKSKKQATQYLYVTLAKDAYYLIGIDVYSDVWEKNKDAIMQSVNTLKLLP